MYSIIFSYCSNLLSVLLSFVNDFMNYMFTGSTILGDNVSPFEFLLGVFVSVLLVRLVSSFL